MRIIAVRVSIAMFIAAIAMSCAAKRAPRAITPPIGARQSGIASWYGPPYHGRATASGEIYDMERDTAAHRRFAFGTWVRVENLGNGKRTEVRINDRGPFVRGRIIDLSRASARQIEMLGAGTAKVRLTVIKPPPPAPPARQAAGKRWGVQVASFRNETLARTLAAQLDRDGRRADPQAAAEGWTRVVVFGAAGTEEEARLMQPDLAKQFPGAVLFSTDYPE